MCTVNAALAAIHIVRSNGFLKFTIHSLDVIEGNHVLAPPIIYQKPSWISLSLPIARLSYHLLHVMFMLLHLFYIIPSFGLRCRVGSNLVFDFMSVAMTSYGTSATYWGMFTAFGVSGICNRDGRLLEARSAGCGAQDRRSNVCAYGQDGLG